MTAALLAFPYMPAPAGVCELCRAEDGVVAEVVLEPGRTLEVWVEGRPRSAWRCARVVRACRRHAGANGAEVPTPNRTTAKPAPEQLALFDAVPYRRGGEAEREQAPRRWS